MNETNHTPGPWYASQSESQLAEGQWSIGLGQSGSGCSEDHTRNDYFLVSGYCSDADAELIAQVPALLAERDALKTSNAQLLEALEQVSEQLARVSNTLWKNKGHSGVTQDALDKARAAIEAATQPTSAS